MLKLIAAVLLAAAGVAFGTSTDTLKYGTYIKFSQMTAPETTTALQVKANASHVWEIVVTAINTRDSLRVEGSIDGSSWFNLDTSDDNILITANNTYAYRSTARICWIRLIWFGEAGGTDSKIQPYYYGGRQ